MPDQRPRDALESRWGGLTEWIHGICSKIKWLLITLIFPEFLVGRALQDWILATKASRDPELKALVNGTEWAIVHAFYANMGGFIVEVRDEELSPPIRTFHARSMQPPEQIWPPDGIFAAGLAPDDPNATLSNAKYRIASSEGKVVVSPKQPAVFGKSIPKEVDIVQASPVEPTPSFDKDKDAEYGSEPSRGVILHANCKQLRLLGKWGLINSLPQISREEIECRGESDLLVKVTAVGQTLWLLIQVVVRGSRHLPISQLEIATLAFAICAFLTYMFSWDKPQNAKLATYVGKLRLRNTAQLNYLSDESGYSFFGRLIAFFVPKRFCGLRPREFLFGLPSARSEGVEIACPIFGAIPNDWVCNPVAGNPAIIIPLPGTREDPLNYGVLGTGAMISGIIFGAVHCVAWDFHFPTPIEQTLWRIASVVSTCVLVLHPLIHTSKVFLFRWVPWFNRTKTAWITVVSISGAFSFLIMVSYVASRMFLMVEIFRTLFFLPSEAYLSTWSSSVPHIG
jgi:hypothetical protein